MNFHIFVLIITILFYIVLKYYKYNVEKKLQKSNLLYLMFIPLVLYLTNYMYIYQENFNSNSIDDSIKSKSESLLSMIYPDTSTI